MKGLKSDYKADIKATCDRCGFPTFNRCGSTGMIICDDCKEGKHKKKNPKPRKVNNPIEDLEI